MTFNDGDDATAVRLIASAIKAGARQHVSLQKITVWLVAGVLAVNTASMLLQLWVVNNQQLIIQRQAEAIPIVHQNYLNAVEARAESRKALGDIYRGINELEKRADRGLAKQGEVER